MRNKDLLLSDFLLAAQKAECPIILLEGTRKLPSKDRPKLVRFAQRLALRLPQARFRAGNAPGTDEAFAKGVRDVDPGRLEYVLPYATHRKKKVAVGSRVYSLDTIPDEELGGLCQKAIEATPTRAGLIRAYMRLRSNNRLTVKALYLIRDALKVIGSRALSLRPATAGIFYVDTERPRERGTGHTIRLCEINGVRIWDQRDWMEGWNESDCWADY